MTSRAESVVLDLALTTLMNLTLTNMKTFNIAINYKAEIEAENEDDAVERFLQEIESTNQETFETFLASLIKIS